MTHGEYSTPAQKAAIECQPTEEFLRAYNIIQRRYQQILEPIQWARPYMPPKGFSPRHIEIGRKLINKYADIFASQTEPEV